MSTLSVNQSYSNPFHLYPASSAAIRRTAPMPTASPTAPTAPAGEAQASPAAQQAMTKAKIGEFTAAATSHLYTGLSPEQKQEFMPQAPTPTFTDRGGAGDSLETPSADRASLRLVTKDGTVHTDNTPNPEGIMRGNFNRQFENALKAGKGDEFASRYMPQGSEGGYQARYDKFGEGGAPMPVDPMRDPDPRVRAAQVTAGARTQSAQAAADARRDSVNTATQGRAKVAQINTDAKTGQVGMTLHSKEDIAKMTTQQRADALANALAVTKSHYENQDAAGQQNADTNAQNAQTRADQAAGKGDVTPESYEANVTKILTAKLGSNEKLAAIGMLPKPAPKASPATQPAPATQGVNNPAAGRDGGRADVGSLQTDNRWEKQDDGTYIHPGLPGSVYKDNGKSLVRVK